MSFAADLHVHSYLSRATSRDLDLEHLHASAQRKGIAVVATGDFTQPRWFAELREKLVDVGGGLFRLRDDLAAAVDETVPAACRKPVRFLLSVEVSSIYKRDERVRKVHNLVYAPDLEAAARIASRLARIGNIESDGRPILGLDSRDLLEITLESSPDAFLIPAHVWTPWFSALGEKSGFDSLADCFRDLAAHVFAAETGLSSDPAMNWRLSSLDRVALVSSSDAHSPEKLGREATRFACDLSYFAMRDALRERSGALLGTIEFFPEEGKYHHEGHRACGVNLAPAEAAALLYICPRCGRALTGGVASRVAALADRPPGFVPAQAKPFVNLIPLCEVLAEVLGAGASSGKVRKCYDKLLASSGDELSLLLDLPAEEAERVGSPLLGEALLRMRRGEVKRIAGYDGEYGLVHVFDEDERKRLLAQMRFAFATEALPKQQATICEAAPERAAASEEHPRPSARTPARAPCDPDQEAAIMHGLGPLLIVAGPGTGKTRTLVERIARLIHSDGVDPTTITAITFTRKAAHELVQRLSARVGAKSGLVSATTFHALGLKLLREHVHAAGLPVEFRILEESARQALLKSLAEKLGLAAEAGKLGQAIARIKTCTPAEDSPSELLRLFAAYEQALAEAQALDFDDLIVRAVRLLESCPEALAHTRAHCRHLLVDEYQDVSALQYRLVRLLAPTDADPCLCVVGDPDQAIYGFRGSDPSYFARFETDYPRARVVTLSRNYRSASPVVALAKAVIDRATGRKPRPLVAEIEPGPEIVRYVVADERAEADLIAAAIEDAVGGMSFLTSGVAQHTHALAFHDIAVLTRFSAQADVIEEALSRSSIPCQRAGDESLTARPHVADLLDRLRRAARRDENAKKPVADLLAALDPDAALDAKRKATVELLCTMAVPFRDDLSAFLEAVSIGRDTDLGLQPQKVSLLTLHASKGLEFPLVFIAGCEDNILPLRLPWLSSADVDEERRLLYVGMTRAKHRLVLLASRRRKLLGRQVENGACPFLSDVPPSLLRDAHQAARPRKPRQLSLL